MAALNKSKFYGNYLTERLFDSIRGGKDVVTIQALLQEGADINAKDSEDYTPLLLACLQNNENIVYLLIMCGANVNVNCFLEPNVVFWTVLHYASKKGWIKIVRTLVKKVPDLNVRDYGSDTAMHHASTLGFLNIVKCLVEEGADVDIKNCENFTPLVCAAKYRHREIVNLLLDFGANVDERMLLYFAARNGWTKLVHSLVKKVPDLNEWDEYIGETALHAASTFGHLEIVKFLAEEGTDVNNRNHSEQTALHNASIGNHLETVKWLLEKGTDINARGAGGETALHVAATNGRLEIVKCLVKGVNNNAKDCERNCDLDARTIYGFTALGEACFMRKFNIAQFLLQAGARWDITDERGYSPLNHVTREGPGMMPREEEKEFKFIKLFIENGAYLNRVDYEAIVKKSSSLKVLQDVGLCWQAIVNKFNNHDLPELFKLPVSGSLPRIEEMKIASNSEVAQAIKRTVRFEIQAKGHCNIMEVRPMVLRVFSVRSVLDCCEKNKSELRNCSKRPGASDSNNKCQNSSKVMRLSLKKTIHTCLQWQDLMKIHNLGYFHYIVL